MEATQTLAQNQRPEDLANNPNYQNAVQALISSQLSSAITIHPDSAHHFKEFLPHVRFNVSDDVPTCSHSVNRTFNKLAMVQAEHMCIERCSSLKSAGIVPRVLLCNPASASLRRVLKGTNALNDQLELTLLVPRHCYDDERWRSAPRRESDPYDFAVADYLANAEQLPQGGRTSFACGNSTIELISIDLEQLAGNFHVALLNQVEYNLKKGTMDRLFRDEVLTVVFSVVTLYPFITANLGKPCNKPITHFDPINGAQLEMRKDLIFLKPADRLGIVAERTYTTERGQWLDLWRQYTQETVVSFHRAHHAVDVYTRVLTRRVEALVGPAFPTTTEYYAIPNLMLTTKRVSLECALDSDVIIPGQLLHFIRDTTLKLDGKLEDAVATVTQALNLRKSIDRRQDVALHAEYEKHISAQDLPAIVTYVLRRQRHNNKHAARAIGDVESLEARGFRGIVARVGDATRTFVVKRFDLNAALHSETHDAFALRSVNLDHLNPDDARHGMRKRDDGIIRLGSPDDRKRTAVELGVRFGVISWSGPPAAYPWIENGRIRRDALEQRLTVMCDSGLAGNCVRSVFNALKANHLCPDGNARDDVMAGLEAAVRSDYLAVVISVGANTTVCATGRNGPLAILTGTHVALYRLEGTSIITQRRPANLNVTGLSYVVGGDVPARHVTPHMNRLRDYLDIGQSVVQLGPVPKGLADELEGCHVTCAGLGIPSKAMHRDRVYFACFDSLDQIALSTALRLRSRDCPFLFLVKEIWVACDHEIVLTREATLYPHSLGTILACPSGDSIKTSVNSLLVPVCDRGVGHARYGRAASAREAAEKAGRINYERDWELAGGKIPGKTEMRCGAAGCKRARTSLTPVVNGCCHLALEMLARCDAPVNLSQKDVVLVKAHINLTSGSFQFEGPITESTFVVLVTDAVGTSAFKLVNTWRMVCDFDADSDVPDYPKIAIPATTLVLAPKPGPPGLPIPPGQIAAHPVTAPVVDRDGTASETSTRFSDTQSELSSEDETAAPATTGPRDDSSHSSSDSDVDEAPSEKSAASDLTPVAAGVAELERVNALCRILAERVRTIHEELLEARRISSQLGAELEAAHQQNDQFAADAGVIHHLRTHNATLIAENAALRDRSHVVVATCVGAPSAPSSISSPADDELETVSTSSGDSANSGQEQDGATAAGSSENSSESAPSHDDVSPSDSASVAEPCLNALVASFMAAHPYHGPPSEAEREEVFSARPADSSSPSQNDSDGEEGVASANPAGSRCPTQSASDGEDRNEGMIDEHAAEFDHTLEAPQAPASAEPSTSSSISSNAWRKLRAELGEVGHSDVEVDTADVGREGEAQTAWAGPVALPSAAPKPPQNSGSAPTRTDTVRTTAPVLPTETRSHHGSTPVATPAVLASRKENPIVPVPSVISNPPQDSCSAPARTDSVETTAPVLPAETRSHHGSTPVATPAVLASRKESPVVPASASAEVKNPKKKKTKAVAPPDQKTQTPPKTVGVSARPAGPEAPATVHFTAETKFIGTPNPVLKPLTTTAVTEHTNWADVPLEPATPQSVSTSATPASRKPAHQMPGKTSEGSDNSRARRKASRAATRAQKIATAAMEEQAIELRTVSSACTGTQARDAEVKIEPAPVSTEPSQEPKPAAFDFAAAFSTVGKGGKVVKVEKAPSRCITLDDVHAMFAGAEFTFQPATTKVDWRQISASGKRQAKNRLDVTEPEMLNEGVRTAMETLLENYGQAPDTVVNVQGYPGTMKTVYMLRWLVRNPHCEFAFGAPTVEARDDVIRKLLAISKEANVKLYDSHPKEAFSDDKQMTALTRVVKTFELIVNTPRMNIIFDESVLIGTAYCLAVAAAFRARLPCVSLVMLGDLCQIASVSAKHHHPVPLTAIDTFFLFRSERCAANIGEIFRVPLEAENLPVMLGTKHIARVNFHAMATLQARPGVFTISPTNENIAHVTGGKTTTRVQGSTITKKSLAEAGFKTDEIVIILTDKSFSVPRSHFLSTRWNSAAFVAMTRCESADDILMTIHAGPGVISYFRDAFTRNMAKACFLMNPDKRPIRGRIAMTQEDALVRIVAEQETQNGVATQTLTLKLPPAFVDAVGAETVPFESAPKAEGHEGPRFRHTELKEGDVGLALMFVGSHHEASASCMPDLHVSEAFDIPEVAREAAKLAVNVVKAEADILRAAQTGTEDTVSLAGQVTHLHHQRISDPLFTVQSMTLRAGQLNDTRRKKMGQPTEYTTAEQKELAHCYAKHIRAEPRIAHKLAEAKELMNADALLRNHVGAMRKMAIKGIGEEIIDGTQVEYAVHGMSVESYPAGRMADGSGVKTQMKIAPVYETKGGQPVINITQNISKDAAGPGAEIRLLCECINHALSGIFAFPAAPGANIKTASREYFDKLADSCGWTLEADETAKDSNYCAFVLELLDACFRDAFPIDAAWEYLHEAIAGPMPLHVLGGISMQIADCLCSGELFTLFLNTATTALLGLVQNGFITTREFTAGADVAACLYVKENLSNVIAGMSTGDDLTLALRDLEKQPRTGIEHKGSPHVKFDLLSKLSIRYKTTFRRGLAVTIHCHEVCTRAGTAPDVHRMIVKAVNKRFNRAEVREHVPRQWLQGLGDVLKNADLTGATLDALASFLAEAYSYQNGDLEFVICFLSALANAAEDKYLALAKPTHAASRRQPDSMF